MLKITSFPLRLEQKKCYKSVKSFAVDCEVLVLVFENLGADRYYTLFNIQ